ncbi:MFS transporter [Phytomonospora sp. NPDC050363]|uniref:MFS transporter n=1 Tax=Phytomonospora sp. NPDC050363 TaxID=3155642 RepID=UPI0033F88DB3
MLLDTPPKSRARTAVDSRFGGLPRQFWIVAGGTIANRIGAMVVPFIVFFLGSKGVTEEATGTVVAALGFGGLLGAVAGGWLTDRIGPRGALLTGLVAAPASLGALYVVPTVPLMIAAALLVGVAGKLYPPAAAALVASVVTGAKRARAFSLMHWAINIGAATAAAMAGFLAERGYGLLFAIDIVTCLVFAGIVLAGVPKSAARTRAAGERGGYGVVVRDRLMMAFLALALVGETTYSLVEFALPLAIRLDGLSPAVFGAVSVVNAVLVVVLQPVLYARLARLGRVRVLAAAWIVIGLGVASTGLASGLWTYMASTVVWSVGEVVVGIVYGGIAADLAPAGAQGRYQGAMNWIHALARLVGPALTTVLFATVGPAFLWWAAAAAGVGAALVVLRMEPRLLERMSRAV